MKKTYLPSSLLIYQQKKDQERQGKVSFRISPEMSKLQVKAYMRAVYNRKVNKVSTSQQRMKLVRVARRFVSSRPAYKKAILSFDSSEKSI